MSDSQLPPEDTTPEVPPIPAAPSAAPTFGAPATPAFPASAPAASEIPAAPELPSAPAVPSSTEFTPPVSAPAAPAFPAGNIPPAAPGIPSVGTPGSVPGAPASAPGAPSAPVAPPSAPAVPSAPAAAPFGADVPPVAPAIPPIQTNPYGAPAQPSANPYTAPAQQNPYGAAPQQLAYGSQPQGGAPGRPQPTYGYQNPSQSYAPGAMPGASGRKFNVLGLISLIAGGLVLITFSWLIPFLNWGAAFVALAGVVVGIFGILAKDRSKVLGIIGTIVSVIALGLSLIFALLFVGLFARAQDNLDDYNETIEELASEAPEDPTEEPIEPSDPSVSGEVLNVGDTATITDINGKPEWEVTLKEVNLDGNQVVADANQFNEPAPSGSTYILLSFDVKYVGTETGLPAMIDVSYLGNDGVEINSWETIATIDGGLLSAAELNPGGTATGIVPILVPNDSIDGSTVQVSGFLSDSEAQFTIK